MEADLTQRARLVPSHSLYLLHGLADLTAPYTHGVAFAKALTEAGIIFRYQVRHPLIRSSQSSRLVSRQKCVYLFVYICFVDSARLCDRIDKVRNHESCNCYRVTRTKTTPYQACWNTLIVP